jgi:hypothetical protein
VRCDSEACDPAGWVFQLLSQYAETSDLKAVSELDNLIAMPYKAYGFEAMGQRQVISVRDYAILLLSL